MLGICLTRSIPVWDDSFVIQAAWMLDISTISAEQKLGLDLADVYSNSDLYR